MREVRYSQGLLELAAGTALLLLALCATMVARYNLYPSLGYLPGFVATPLLFWGTTQAQKRLPETAKLTTAPELPRYLVLLVFAGLLLASLLQPFLFPELFSESGLAFFLSLIVAGVLLVLRSTAWQTWFLAGLSLLLGLGLTLYAPPERAALLYCLIVGSLLIPTGVVTLRRELPS